MTKNKNANLKLEAKSKTEKTAGKVQKKVGQVKNFLGGSVMLICNNYVMHRKKLTKKNGVYLSLCREEKT